jgi:hypothetical protein
VQAKRRAKRERDEVPVDVIADWTRLRRAQVLVEDLARQGLVDVDALGEQMAMVGDLRTLLVADKRATDLGAEPSAPARQQVHEVADLLVALAAEAVEHQAEQVGRSGAPATLRDARERLATLRQARNEVDAMDDRAGQANDLIERARADRAGERRGAGHVVAQPRQRDVTRRDSQPVPVRRGPHLLGLEAVVADRLDRLVARLGGHPQRVLERAGHGP